MARGAELHERFCDLNLQARVTGAALDRLPYACLLQTPEGRSIAVSRGARELLALGDGLRLEPSGLSAWRAHTTREIRAAVCRASQGEPRWLLRVQRPSGRAPFELLVTALSVAALATFPGTAAASAPRTATGNPTPSPAVSHDAEPTLGVVGVFIVDPDRDPAADEQTLRAQYGFTRAEAHLATLLLRGHTLEEAADQLCVSLNTVRTHLARMFLKSDTGRQAQLLRLLLSGISRIRIA